MKLTVLGCYQVVGYIPPDNSAIIRIGDTEGEFEELKGKYKKKLELCFYDIYPSPHVPNNFNEFRKKDFNNIIDFFKDIESEQVDELVIHCHAGVSRSPAIAIMYAWIKSDEELLKSFLRGGTYIPNGYMLKKISEWLEIENENIAKSLVDKYYHPKDWS